MLYFQIDTVAYSTKKQQFGLDVFEEGVLARLMIQQAMTEAPLPSSIDRLCQIIGGKTKKYKSALLYVLNNFFIKTDSGYINEDVMSRAEDVKEKQERARRSAIARHNKASKEEEYFDTERNANAVQTQCERNAKREKRKENNINPLSITDVIDVSPLKADDKNSLPKAKSLSPIPSDFGITPEISCWYEKKLKEESSWKREDLPRFVESFIDYCKSSGKKYKDYHAALKNCIKADWYQVRQQRIRNEKSSRNDFQNKSISEIFGFSKNEKEINVYEMDERADDGIIFKTNGHLPNKLASVF